MAGNKRKTEAEIISVLQEAGIDAGEMRVMNAEHLDFANTLELIQSLVNEKKLFCSDFVTFENEAIRSKLVPVSKNKGNVKEAETLKMIVDVLKADHMEVYNKIKDVVLERLLAKQKDELAIRLGI